LFSLFGISPLELTDRPVDLNLLPLPKTSELREKLLNAGKIDNMINLLNDYIADLIVETKADWRIIKYATNEIAKNTSKESLVLVQKDLHVTERTFQRMFEKTIGIAPNLYRRICQFNSAFEQLNRRKYYKLSDIAFENGYADQSHYIRAFKEFTNITPKDYLKFAAEG
jgi:AraC-like DNA-binding protein